MKKDNWIQGAHLKEGAFTAKAQAAGMSPQAYAEYVLANPRKYDSVTVREATLAKTFKRMANRRRRGK